MHYRQLTEASNWHRWREPSPFNLKRSRLRSFVRRVGNRVDTRPTHIRITLDVFSSHECFQVHGRSLAGRHHLVDCLPRPAHRLPVPPGAGQVGIDLWPYVLAKGLLFDLATLAFLVAPVCLYEAVLPNRWRTSFWHKTLRLKWLWFSVFVMLFGIGAEVTFWLEFSTRFNFIAVDYLLYTQEVIGNIRQSYPVPTVLAAIAVVAGLIVWFLRGAVRNMDNVKITRIQRAKLVAAGVVLPVIAGFTVSVDQMEGAGNAYADEISGNGLFTLAAAMRRNELDFDRFYRTMPQSKADRILQTMGMQRRPLSDLSAQALKGAANHAWPFTRRPRNVVLISVESLSASFLGAYGDSRGLTPRLDAIAKQGLLFSHAYATGTRTVRGLEALSLGTPPVPGQAIVRRPQNEHLATLGEVLGSQGLKPYFFYGGYGYFDNMNAYFGGNGYKVIDRTDMDKRTIVEKVGL